MRGCGLSTDWSKGRGLQTRMVLMPARGATAGAFSKHAAATSRRRILAVPSAREQSLAHMRRHRSCDFDRIAILVKRHHDLARKQMQDRPAEARRAAINGVAHDRPAAFRAMHAQLMRAAGDRLEREPGLSFPRRPMHFPGGGAGWPCRIDLHPPAAAFRRACRAAGRYGLRPPPGRPRPAPNRSCRSCPA